MQEVCQHCGRMRCRKRGVCYTGYTESANVAKWPLLSPESLHFGSQPAQHSTRAQSSCLNCQRERSYQSTHICSGRTSRVGNSQERRSDKLVVRTRSNAHRDHGVVICISCSPSLVCKAERWWTCICSFRNVLASNRWILMVRIGRERTRAISS